MNSDNALVPKPKPIGNDLAEVIELGKIFASSNGFPGLSNPALAIVKILAGRELGFPAVASVMGIHLIEGKPSIGSHLLAAAIRSSGRYDYEILEHTDQVCAIRFRRKLADGSWRDLEPVEKLTLKEAHEKGWTTSGGNKPKLPWLKTPKNMLFARAISNGYKFHCPDLFAGLLLYDADELESTSPSPIEAAPFNGQVIERQAETPEPPPVPEPAPDPTPPAQEAVLTQEEYDQVVSLGRQHGLNVGNVKAICAALGVPVLDRAPQSRLPWLLQAMTTGLVQTAEVDSITKLVEALSLNWTSLTARLQAKYGASSLAHLLPSQAQEVKDLLLKELNQRAKQAALLQAAS